MGIRRLTRGNFYEVGDWAHAYECWGLAAPIPELRFGRWDRFRRARLGDLIVKFGRRVWVVSL